MGWFCFFFHPIFTRYKAGIEHEGEFPKEVRLLHPPGGWVRPSPAPGHRDLQAEPSQV